MSPPTTRETPTARGEALLAGGRPDEAVAAFTAALALRPRDSAAWRGLGKAQLDLGDRDAARSSFARALAIVPYDRYAAHMLASLSGEADAQATGYVSDLFDTYADDFDAHLTGALNYRIPQAIRALLAERAPFASLLDLGCGTGLVGTALSDMVAAMDGVDIAPRMIRKAHERGLYRHLRTGDLLDSLAADPALRGPYDLVTAADVFVYLGPLEAIFAATATILAPHGLLVFSVETAAGDAPVLRSSGRFAHPAAYIARLAIEFGFTLDVAQSHPIRQERDQPIPGALYLLTRN
jgi:predicted TPR repeat methyltransferase